MYEVIQKEGEIDSQLFQDIKITNYNGCHKKVDFVNCQISIPTYFNRKFLSSQIDNFILYFYKMKNSLVQKGFCHAKKHF